MASAQEITKVNEEGGQEGTTEKTDLTGSSRLEDSEETSNAVRHSLRLEENKLTRELEKSIELQSEIHVALLKELGDQVEFRRLSAIKSSLEQSAEHVNELFDKLKVISDTPKRELLKEIDRLTRDRQIILEQVDLLLSELAARPKDESFQVAQSVRSTKSSTSKKSYRSAKAHSVRSHRSYDALSDKSKQGSIDGSIKSQSSIASSVKSKSTSKTSRSHSVSILRMKATQIAEQELDLQAELQSEQLENELLKKKSEIEQAKILAKLEAEKKKKDIIRRAIQEEQEEVGSAPMLLRPPSHSPVLNTTESLRLLMNPRYDQHRQASHAYGQPIETQAAQPSSNVRQNILPSKTYATVDQPRENPGYISSQLATDAQENPQPEYLTSHVSETKQLAEAITESMHSVVNASRLPPPEPFEFSGDPLKYSDWKVAFDALIDKRNCTSLEKLHYLKRYVSGTAKEAIDGYFLLQSDQAYEQAKQTLQARFGDPFVIADKFRDKIEQWPKITAKMQQAFANSLTF